MRSITFIAIGILAASPLTAAEPTRNSIQIPPQDLRPALQTFAKIEHLHVLFLSEDVQNLQTEGVSGTLTPTEALEQLLRGTALTYQALLDRSIMILPARATARSGQNESEVSAGEAIDLSGGPVRPGQVIITAPSQADTQQLASFRELGDVSRDEYKRLVQTLPFEKNVTVRFPGTVNYENRSPLGTHVQSANTEGLVVSRVFRFTEQRAETALLIHNSNTYPVFIEVDYSPTALGDGAYLPLAPGKTGLAIAWQPTLCLPVGTSPLRAMCVNYSITPGTAHLHLMRNWANREQGGS